MTLKKLIILSDKSPQKDCIWLKPTGELLFFGNKGWQTIEKPVPPQEPQQTVSMTVTYEDNSEETFNVLIQ